LCAAFYFCISLERYSCLSA